MKKKIISGILLFMLLFSCDVSKTVNEGKVNSIVLDEKKVKGISLDANHRSNDEIRLVYNSIDTISTKLIINNQIIERSKIKGILDTIKFQNYFIDINKEKRIIEMIKR